MCGNQKALLDYRKNRLTLLEDHEGKVMVDGEETPFHVKMLENENRIVAEAKAAVEAEREAARIAKTEADSSDSEGLIQT